MTGVGTMGWMWLWPALVVLGLFLVITAGVVWTRGSGATSAGRSGRSARQILDERFARGEIDQDEYQRRRTELE